MNYLSLCAIFASCGVILNQFDLKGEKIEGRVTEVNPNVGKQMWVFGYGSLIWKVDFPYEMKLVGCIKGYVRRFYQHSIDHRGTPQNPGRVVTLIPSNEDSAVWGVAYKIKGEDIDSVTKYLDFREKNGYTKRVCTFHPISKDHAAFDLSLYVATEDNESYAGPASIEDIAKQVVDSIGPSGPNKEYVYNLAQAMRDIAPGVQDDHLFALEEAVKRLDCSSSDVPRDNR